MGYRHCCYEWYRRWLIRPIPSRNWGFQMWHISFFACERCRLLPDYFGRCLVNWIGLSRVLRPRQHSICVIMGDGFYRSKDPTNSITILKEKLQRKNQTTKTTQYTYAQTIHKIRTTSPLVYTNMGWLGEGSHKGQGRQASAAVGLPPRYPLVWWTKLLI